MWLTNVDMSESDIDSKNCVKLIVLNSSENGLKWKVMKAIAETPKYKFGLLGEK